MKVAYLLGSLNRGGTETLMLDVLKNHRHATFDIVCFYRKSGVLESDFLASGATIKKLQTNNNPVKFIFELRGNIKENKIDIVHSHQFIDAVYSFFATIGLKTKIVQTFHGYDYNVSTIGKLLLNFAIKITDRNVFVSNNVRDYYQKKYKLNSENQEVVYNGISFEKFNEVNIENDIRKELKLHAGSLLFGTVGNFVHGRDPYTICKFLLLLKSETIDFNFIFIGKKSDTLPEKYNECVKFCAEHKLENQVHFLGSRNDVPGLLKQMDAFIYSTDHDTFGIAVIEAISAGIPVFVNDWSVMLEVTDNGKLANVYQTKNENDLLVKFIDYLNNRELYKNNAIMNAMKIRHKFNIQQHIDSLYQLYKTI